MNPLLHAVSPLRASQLLTDFICAPVGMKPAQHIATIRHLHALASGALHVQSSAPGYLQWAFDGCKGEPWAAPLYEVDAATGIARMEITGALVKGYDDVTCWLYQCASIDRISRELAEIDARSDIRALIVVINSPGGVSIGMPEVTAQLADMCSRLLVVTHTGDTAASNGMRFGVSGGLFLPTASACVGCIGTYIALYDYTKMLDAMGIKLELYRAGKYKGIGLEGKPTSEEEAAFIQASVDRSNEIFRDFVRGRRPGVADSSMEGQWFDGTQAVELGLADATVTGLPEVLRTVAQQLAAA